MSTSTIVAESWHSTHVRTNQEDVAFSRFLARLAPDRDRAWRIYRELWQKLVSYFSRHSYSFEAEELSDEVIDEIVGRYDLETISSLPEFAFGVARNVRMRMPRRRKHNVEIADPDCLPGGKEDPENLMVVRLDREQKLACFRKCWRQLSLNEQKLLSEYYPDDGEGLEKRRERLAQALGVSVNNLRTKIFRIKDKLENHFVRHLHGRQQTCRPSAQGTDMAVDAL